MVGFIGLARRLPILLQAALPPWLRDSRAIGDQKLLCVVRPHQPVFAEEVVPVVGAQLLRSPQGKGSLGPSQTFRGSGHTVPLAPRDGRQHPQPWKRL